VLTLIVDEIDWFWSCKYADFYNSLIKEVFKPIPFHMPNKILCYVETFHTDILKDIRQPSMMSFK
jgi:hypothetical protein